MHIRDNQVIFEKSETSDKNGWSNGKFNRLVKRMELFSQEELRSGKKIDPGKTG